MIYENIAVRAQASAGWLVAALGFTLPISTAADGILLVLLLTMWLIAAPAHRAEIKRTISRTPPVLVALILFGLLFAACFYGVAPLGEAFSWLGKYNDLLLIPVLAWAATAAPVLRRALLCLAVAIVLNLLLSYAAAGGIMKDLPVLSRNPDYPIGFKASVTLSILSSLGAFLFLLLARETRSAGRRVVLVILALICAHHVLFIVIGRTGYLLLAALLAYFIGATVRGWRGPTLAVTAGGLLLFTAYFVSPNFHERISEMTSDVSRWRPGAADGTSVGLRVGYYRTTASIIAEHPFTGVGTGGFAGAYAQKVNGSRAPTTSNPHNDYLLIGAQTGIPGIVLLLTLYAVVWRTARNLPSPLERDLARGLVIAMVIGGSFNSLLLDHTEGLLFAWLVAVLYARYDPPARA